MTQVSVVIPTFNRWPLLAEALTSIAAQRGIDFELIIVDDGSTDETAARLPALLEQLTPPPHPVRIFRTANRGPAAARNRGVSEASAPLIAFLDSDDLWQPGKLQRQLDHMKHNPQCVASQTEEIWIRRGIRVNPGQRHRKRGGDFFLDSLRTSLVSPSAVMMRTSTFRELGGFDQAMAAAEDYDLWLRLLVHHRVELLPQPLVIRRAGHSGQLSATVPAIDRFRILALLKLLLRNDLSAEQRQAVCHTLTEKCRIYSKGAVHRGKAAEAQWFASLANMAEKSWRQRADGSLENALDTIRAIVAAQPDSSITSYNECHELRARDFWVGPEVSPRSFPASYAGRLLSRPELGEGTEFTLERLRPDGAPPRPFTEPALEERSAERFRAPTSGRLREASETRDPNAIACLNSVAVEESLRVDPSLALGMTDKGEVPLRKTNSGCANRSAESTAELASGSPDLKEEETILPDMPEKEIEKRVHGWAVAKSLPRAYLQKWLALDEPGRTRLLAIAEGLKMHTGQFIAVLGLIEEIAIRERQPIGDILDRAELRRVVNSVGSGPGRARLVLDELRALRYPKLKRAGERLTQELSAIRLPPGVKVVLPSDLASDEVRVEIVAYGSAQMAQVLAALTAKSAELVRLAAMLDGTVGGLDTDDSSDEV
jgi:glycosyltransferase involved in cell wall biosynthesis